MTVSKQSRTLAFAGWPTVISVKPQCSCLLYITIFMSRSLTRSLTIIESEFVNFESKTED